MTRSEAAAVTATANALHGVAALVLDGAYDGGPEAFAALVQAKMVELYVLAAPFMTDAPPPAAAT